MSDDTNDDVLLFSAKNRHAARRLYASLGVELPLGKRLDHLVAGDKLPALKPIEAKRRRRQPKGKQKADQSGAPPRRRVRLMDVPTPEEEEEAARVLGFDLLRDDGGSQGDEPPEIIDLDPEEEAVVLGLGELGTDRPPQPQPPPPQQPQREEEEDVVPTVFAPPSPTPSTAQTELITTQSLVEALFPRLIWPRDYLWGSAPRALVEYQAALVTDTTKYFTLFDSLTQRSPELRERLENPEFRNLMYRTWYSRPVEGIDGRPDPSTYHTRDEVLGMQVPDRTNLTGSGWYRAFYYTALYDSLRRWLMMARVRLWRLLFVTRRIAYNEVQARETLRRMRIPFPAAETVERSTGLDWLLPETYQELAQQYPYVGGTLLKLKQRSPNTAWAAVLRAMVFGAQQFWFISDGNLVDATQFGPRLFPTSASPEIVAAGANGIKFLLRSVGAVAPGVLMTLRRFMGIERGPGAPLEEGLPGLIPQLLALVAQAQPFINFDRIPSFEDVPNTADLPPQTRVSFGRDHTSRLRNVRRWVVQFDKPLSLGVKLAKSSRVRGGHRVTRRRYIFTVGGLGVRLGLRLAMVHLGDSKVAHGVLMRFVQEHRSRKQHPIEDGLAMVLSGTTYDLTAAGVPDLFGPLILAAEPLRVGVLFSNGMRTARLGEE